MAFHCLLVWRRRQINARAREWLGRYISRPMVAEKRLSLTPNANVHFELSIQLIDATHAANRSAEH